MSRDQEYVLRTVEERGVRLVRLWFTDVLGQLKSVAISPAELESAFSEGVQFDGTAIDGFSRVHESDVLARPDATTFELLPWAKEDEPSGRMFCDIENLDGTPFEGDPRQILRRNLQSAREQGYSFFAAPEAEFFYFASGDPSLGKPQPLDRASYFDLTTSDVSSDLRKRTIHMLEAMGIPVEYSFHEDSPSQHEIDLRYTEALDMADNVMTLRLVVKKIAMERDTYATFMPKPLNGVQGSGMHTHLSLFDGETNVFHDPDDEYGMSETARRFTAGILRHAREITAVTNQLVNSYKRLAETSEAPPFVAWARNNRSAGPATIGRPWCGCRCAGKTRPSRLASSTGPSMGPAIRISPTPCCLLRGCAVSPRATSCPWRPTSTCSNSPTASVARWASHRCPGLSTRRSM